MSWTEDGTSFAILNIDDFGKLLCRYFKINNLASFVRQLNMYSFRKVKNGGRAQEFYHPNFKRGAFEELSLIQRKKVQPKGTRTPKYDHGRETGQRLEALQQKLEDLMDQNRMLITTNKRFMAKIGSKNRECAVRERKLLFLCAALGSKLCKADGLKRMLARTGVKTPEFDSDVYEGVLDCFRQSCASENSVPDFIDELLDSALERQDNSITGRSMSSRVKSVLERTYIEPELVQSLIVPKTAFAFHFPKKRAVSAKSEQSESPGEKNLLDVDQEREHAQNLISPAYSGYKLGMSGDEYMDEPVSFRPKEVSN